MEAISKLLEKLACCHDWEKIEEVATYESENSQRPFKRTYLMVCRKCGKIKTIVIK